MPRLLLFALLALSLRAAAPCVHATAACLEKVATGPAGRHVGVYRSYPLGTPNPAVTRAMIIVHGATRNADHYFATGVGAAFLAHALEDTIVVAPRFAVNDGRASRDKLDEGELSWVSAVGWAGGGHALSLPDVSTYDAMDQILRKLADRKVFPNLKRIVVSGHSAGGQFTSRYAALNQLHDTLGAEVRYVVSNPSTLLYLDELRPPREGTGFRPFWDRENCGTFNDYKYGLEKRTGYAARLTADQIRKNLTSRPVIYLIGELDTLPIAGFDSTCVAMAQGPDRFSRAKAYFEHVTTRHGATGHKFVPVPLCGHNNRCVWTADVALPILFP
jgi:pimeloyl-ACP methyl ester carboxylesterase